MKWDKPIWLSELTLSPEQQEAVDRARAAGNAGRNSRNYSRIKAGRLNWWGLPEGDYNVHRVVAEICLQTKLPKSVEVHHLNEKLWDNWPGNLVVCNLDWHRWFHRKPELRFASRLPGAPQVRVRCACGCGKRRQLYGINGRPCRYIHGHAPGRPRLSRV